MAAKKTSAGTVALYISLAGNDRWSGRYPEPTADGKDGPLASVAGAQATIRRWKKQGKPAAVNVWIRSGTYCLDKPIVFTPADSGTQRHPIVYAAYPGETAVFSGGKKLTGWSVGEHNQKPCWTISLPDVKAGSWNFTQLFVNGVRRSRPRWPSEGFYRFKDFVAGYTGTGKWCHGPDRMQFVPGEIRNWKNLSDVELVTLQLWIDTHHRIAEVDEAANIVRFRNESTASLQDEKSLHARYFVENVFEALTEPGQWYLDRAKGELMYLPLEGEKIENTEIIAPVLEELVVFQGAGKKNVSHIRLENLAFRYAEWTRPADYVGDAQAAYSVPGAVVFDQADDCVLYSCEISHVLQYAVEVRTGSANDKIVACSMFDLGAGGVKIGHEELLRVDETSREVIKAKDNRPMHTTVSDCTIHENGKIYPSAIGIWIGNSGSHRIRHNHLYNLTYTGISCGWTWGYNPTRTTDNRIEYNHIHHINYDGYISDNGGIYSLGPNPGLLIRGNVIHDIGYYGYGGWGIYQDEGTSQSIVEDNLVYRTKGASFFTHYGRDNMIRNNIFASAGEKQVVPFHRRELHRTSILENNIVYWNGGGLWNGTWEKDNSLLRDNVFWACGREVDFTGVSLEAMQEQGQLLGTKIVDPLFHAPDAGDFALRSDSPVLKAGFKPFDSSLAGPRYGKTLPASFAKWPAEKEPPREIVFAEMEWIKPIRFDNLKTPGKVRLKLTNVGLAVARGKVKFVASPQAQLIGAKPLAYTLKPGASISTTLDVLADADAEKVIVETIPTGKGLLPSFVITHKPRNANITISRTLSIKSPADVATILDDAKRYSIQYMKRSRAELSFIVAGEDLAVLADIHDQNMQVKYPPWMGASLEVFGAKAGDEVPAVGQTFLVPGTNDAKPRTMRQANMQTMEEPSIRLESALTADGYRLMALIPLTLLNVSPQEETFLLECKLNWIPEGSKEPATSKVFGIDSYANPKEFGTVTVH